MDGFDLLILGFMLRAIAAGLGIPVAQAASLATATLIGAVLGGLLFGMLSDRLGRVRVLTWTIVIFAVFTGLCALAQAIGACWLSAPSPASASAASSASAWRWWPRPGPPPSAPAPRPMSGWAGRSASWRRPSSRPLLLPTIGWRGMFAVGVLPAVAAFFIRRDLDEPALFVSESRAGRAANPRRCACWWPTRRRRASASAW